MDIIPKERAAFALEVRREGKGTWQVLWSLSGWSGRGEPVAGLVAADWQAGFDCSMHLFSAPRDCPWKVTASLEEVCTWEEVMVSQVLFPIGSSRGMA